MCQSRHQDSECEHCRQTGIAVHGTLLADLYGLMSDKLNLAKGDKYHWQTEARALQGKQVARFVRQAVEGGK